MMGTFWINVNDDAEISAKVKTSFKMENETSRVAVAGDPAAVAVTLNVDSGVTLEGIPVITPFESNDNPVSTSAGADNDTVRPDAAVALN
jgi:hypothetical protein